MFSLERCQGFHAIAGNVDAIAHLIEQPEGDLLVDHVVIGQQQVQREVLSQRGFEFIGGNDFFDGGFRPAHYFEQNVVQSLAIAHRAYVLEGGRIALSGEAAELAENADLRRTYLGY